MIKKILLLLVVLIALPIAWFYAVGKGWIHGEPWQSAPVTSGPRHDVPVNDAAASVDNPPQILFGDLHTHTNYSLDAYVFNTALMKDLGITTPADACDFARYCSALDFWSINDHAESLTPRVWQDTVNAVRACNAQAGNARQPDMVSFLGWEWSHGNRDDIPSHYGHKNVIFRTWEPGVSPIRPIASSERYMIARLPAVAIGLASLADDLKTIGDLAWYINEVSKVPICPDGVSSDELPDDCREVAVSPSVLYRKLDELGFDSLVIPHGLAWGTTNPLTADFRNQLSEYENRYQKLIESYSGHGNSERYVAFQRTALDAAGNVTCPPSTSSFKPCCQRARELAMANCEDTDKAGCVAAANSVMQAYAEAGAREGRKLLPDATLDDWAGCGQLQGAFQPASMYVPRQSTQYNLSLGFDTKGKASRVKVGLIGSSDNHVARPGNSYKELNRPLMTDNKSVTGKPAAFSIAADEESGGFYYTGGLVAVHAKGKHRDAIWEALENRNVYATSGDRMLVWFDLLNAPDGEAPMGSDVVMSDEPRFRVRALGAFEQTPGCPAHVTAALGEDRVQTLCGGECFQPGDTRKPITRIEITRIRPQQAPDEPVEGLIEHKWKVFQCPLQGQEQSQGCTVEFSDPDFPQSRRAAVYYARVLQAEQLLISGDPFGCEYDEAGTCIQRNYCINENAGPDQDCLGKAEPRAWTSPIYIDVDG